VSTKFKPRERGARVDAFVRPRWAAWLADILEDGKLEARDLARELASKPANIQTHPRALVRAWLEQKRTVSADSALNVGEKLAALETRGASGPIALFAAGHFGAFIRYLDYLSATPAGARHAAVLVMFSWVAMYEFSSRDSLAGKTQSDEFWDWKIRALAVLDTFAHFDRKLLLEARERYNQNGAVQYADLNHSVAALPALQFLEAAAARLENDLLRPDEAALDAWLHLERWAKAIAPKVYEAGKPFMSAFRRYVEFVDENVGPNAAKALIEALIAENQKKRQERTLA
jgi:hypothetical protein